MSDSTTESVRQLFEYGAVHIDTFRPDGWRLALRTTVSLSGDLITKIDPSYVDPDTLRRHNERVLDIMGPIFSTLQYTRSLIDKLKHLRVVLLTSSGLGNLAAMVWNHQAHSFSWVKQLGWLSASLVASLILSPLLRSLFHLMVRRKLAMVLAPTGQNANAQPHG